MIWIGRFFDLLSPWHRDLWITARLPAFTLGDIGAYFSLSLAGRVAIYNDLLLILWRFNAAAILFAPRFGCIPVPWLSLFDIFEIGNFLDVLDWRNGRKEDWCVGVREMAGWEHGRGEKCGRVLALSKLRRVMEVRWVV